MPTSPIENPLSSAHVRLARRPRAVSPAAGEEWTRPFGLRGAVPVPAPVSPSSTYCPRRQVAVGDDGQPLVETMKKDWKTKAASDGDEGPEETYGWEEEPDE